MLNILSIASSAMQAQSQRLNATASNLANIDSITSTDQQVYKPKHVIFESQASDKKIGGVHVKDIFERDDFLLEYSPKHPLADSQGYIKKPNINPIEEMTDMISASRSYQLNVEVFNTAKQLTQQTLKLGES